MDDARFDALTRGAALLPTRRAMLSAIVAGVASAVLGERATTQAAGRAAGDICRKGGDCVSGVCLPKDATGRQRCACGGPGYIDCGNGCIKGECCYTGDLWCDDHIACTTDVCVNNRCQSIALECDDGKTCTTSFCDLVLKQCVNIETGMCALGEFFANGSEECGPFGPAVCQSQYCLNGVCAENPSQCTNYGHPCSSSSECCYGAPCTRGYCWDGDPSGALPPEATAPSS